MGTREISVYCNFNSPNPDNHDLLRIEMMFSKSKVNEGIPAVVLLNPGMTTNLLSHKMANKLKIKITKTPHITLINASGEQMELQGLASCE